MLLFAAQDEVVTFKIDCFATKGALHSESEQILWMANVFGSFTEKKNAPKIGLKTYAQK